MALAFAGPMPLSALASAAGVGRVDVDGLGAYAERRQQHHGGERGNQISG